MKTKKIQLTQGLVGDGFAHVAGDILEWNTVEADRMIERGIAVPFEGHAPAAKPAKAKGK